MYLGDYAEYYATLNFAFTSRTVAGVPIVLAGTPVISVYKGSATGTEKTSAESYITLSVDFDSVAGLNNVLIDLSGDAFFEVGEDYKVVITTGTVNSVSVVGEVVAEFSIENRFATTMRGTDNAALATALATAQTAIDLIPTTAMRGTDGANTTTPPTVANIADAVWDEAQSGHMTGGTFGKYLDSAISDVGGTGGSGADTVTITIDDGSNPIADADVWITSDAAGTAVVAGTLQTNSSGQITVLLDAGNTYYLWMQKDGENPINGEQFTATAD